MTQKEQCEALAKFCGWAPYNVAKHGILVGAMVTAISLSVTDPFAPSQVIGVSATDNVCVLRAIAEHSRERRLDWCKDNLTPYGSQWVCKEGIIHKDLHQFMLSHELFSQVEQLAIKATSPVAFGPQYTSHLKKLTAEGDLWFCASIIQRVEALLKTLGLWKAPAPVGAHGTAHKRREARKR